MWFCVTSKSEQINENSQRILSHVWVWVFFCCAQTEMTVSVLKNQFIFICIFIFINFFHLHNSYKCAEWNGTSRVLVLHIFCLLWWTSNFEFCKLSATELVYGGFFYSCEQIMLWKNKHSWLFMILTMQNKSISIDAFIIFCLVVFFMHFLFDGPHNMKNLYEWINTNIQQ